MGGRDTRREGGDFLKNPQTKMKFGLGPTQKFDREISIRAWSD